MDDTDRRRSGRRGPLARITNAAAGAIDVNAVVESIDVEEVVDRIDVNALLDRVDIDRLLGRVDVDALLTQADVDALLARVDVNVLLDRVDVDRLLERVEPDVVLDKVDVDRLLARVDVNALLDRTDPDRLMARVDVNAVVDRVDIKAIVDRAGIKDIVNESTGQVAGSVLDAARRQVVSVDEIAGRIAFRAVGKDPRKMPEGPDRLISGGTQDERGRSLVSGHYAGPLSRFAAFLIDLGVVFGAYTVVASALGFFVSRVLGVQIPTTTATSVFGVVALATWAFTYMFVGLAIAGASVGKSIVGLKVVAADGSPLVARQALVRTLTYPVAFVPFGMGLIGIAFGTRRNAWYDRFARTCVVIDWGDRPAALPAPLTAWIDGRGAQ